MKYLFSMLLCGFILSGCSKKDEINPDDLITYEKHVYLSKINSCDTIFTFFIPNGFTPNHDGINDYWEPKSCGLDSSQYHIDILDKKGKIIFQSDVPTKYRGKGKDGYILAEQTLCYYIEARDRFGNNYKYKGQFSIIM
jgi:gliding motility-associated-like protein